MKLRMCVGLFLVLAGCNGVSVEEAADQVCEAKRAHRMMCSPERAYDVAECVEFQRCLLPFMRDDAYGPLSSCLNRACDESDDRCYSAAGLGLDPSSDAVAYQASCIARRQECSEMDSSFSDDYCFFDIANDESISVFQDCLQRSCGDIGVCIRDTIPCRD